MVLTEKKHEFLFNLKDISYFLSIHSYEFYKN